MLHLHIGFILAFAVCDAVVADSVKSPRGARPKQRRWALQNHLGLESLSESGSAANWMRTKRVQILSTNDFYQPDGQPLLDQGTVGFAFEGNLLTSENPALNESLQQAWNLLPSSFPNAFLPANLCADVAEGEAGKCMAAAPDLRSGAPLLKDVDNAAFPNSSGNLWQEGHLGCFASMQDFRQKLMDSTSKFGNLVDLMMTYQASRERFSTQHPGGKSFSVMPGDYLGPSLMSMLLKGTGKYGQHVIESFNHINMDYVVIGNHELDPGDATFRLGNSTFEALTANIRKESGEMLHKRHLDYKIDQVGDTRVCWFGVTADDDAKAASGKMKKEKVSLKGFQAVSLEVQKQLKKNGRCNITVALTHLRVAQDLQLYKDSVDCEKKHECGHLDAILGAHDHFAAFFNLENPWNSKITHFWKMGQNGQFVIDLQIDPSGRSGPHISLVPVVEGACQEQPADLKEISAWVSQNWDSSYSDLVGIKSKYESETNILSLKEHQSPFQYRGRWDTQHVRAFETRAGNLIADLMRLAEGGGADVAVLNGGTVRGDNWLIRDQNLSMFDLKMELPFGDKLVMMETTLLMLVGVVMEGLQDRRLAASANRFIVSGVEVLFTPAAGDELEEVQHWAKTGGPQEHPYTLTPASDKPLLALHALDFYGRAHGGGARETSVMAEAARPARSAGAAMAEACPTPPCRVVEDMKLKLDANLRMVLTTNDYAALRDDGSRGGTVVRIMGELARWETHCARGARNFTMTVTDSGPYSCDGGLPAANFYEDLEQVLEAKNGEVYKAMQDLLKDGHTQVLCRPDDATKYRRMLVGRPSADLSGEGESPLAAAAGNKIVIDADGCMEGANAATSGVRDRRVQGGAEDLLPGFMLMRRKMAEIHDLPYPRWLSVPINKALEEEIGCLDIAQGERQFCIEALASICMEVGPRDPKTSIDADGDIVQMSPQSLKMCESLAQSTELRGDKHQKIGPGRQVRWVTQLPLAAHDGFSIGGPVAAL